MATTRASVTGLSAPASRLAFEHSPASAAALAGHARQMPGLQPYAPLWKGGLGDEAPGWLTGHGWQPRFRELAAIAGSCHRPVPGPGGGGFLTATRRRLMAAGLPGIACVGNGGLKW